MPNRIFSVLIEIKIKLFSLLIRTSKQPFLTERLEAGKRFDHQTRAEHAHDEVADYADKQSVAEGVDRTGRGFAENLRENVRRTEHADEHDGNDQNRDVAVDDRPKAVGAALLNGAVQRFAGAEFFLNTARGDNVRIHAHADGKDNTRKTRQSHCKAVHKREVAGNRRKG